MFKIGNVVISNKIVLAPMAGISNSAFRQICREMGAGLVCTEMVSDLAIKYKSIKTYKMLEFTDEERPISIQIFGSATEDFVSAAKFIEENYKPDIIDINMGCPVNKVAVKKQAGSGLLKNPNAIYELVKSVVDAVSIPVTVKIRSGWDNENINCVEVAKLIEKAGASAISIHPRTRSQGYSGKADWNLIKSIKECVSIPVIGNGDIKSCYDAKRMLDETKCDAIMIGRACIGNPWIFRETDEYLKDGKTPKAINNLEVFEILNKHIDLLQKTIGDKLAVLEIRPHIANYLKHFRNSSELINKIFRTKNIIEVKNLLIEYRNNSNV